MNYFTILMLALLMVNVTSRTNAQQKAVLVIHGGAGDISSGNMDTASEKAYRAKLAEALRVGWEILEKGGSSLDAITKVIQLLEDSPLFNAGRGSVFTSEGKHELDASIMDGQSGLAGAVAGVRTIKNPIAAARAVMEHSQHVMLSGEGAEQFAAAQGLAIVDPTYFFDEKRFKQFKRLQNFEPQDKKDEGYAPDRLHPAPFPARDQKFGTVGAVALDLHGNLAAGTSTGGMLNKQFGRIGDSPVIGAGTYANNKTCAVSATGHGEYFLRNVVAYDISALIEYKGLTLQEATDEVIMNKLVKKGGDGGVIAIDDKGKIAMPFNTPGMFRGYIRENNEPKVFIFKREN